MYHSDLGESVDERDEARPKDEADWDDGIFDGEVMVLDHPLEVVDEAIDLVHTDPDTGEGQVGSDSERKSISGCRKCFYISVSWLVRVSPSESVSVRQANSKSQARSKFRA